MNTTKLKPIFYIMCACCVAVIMTITGCKSTKDADKSTSDEKKTSTTSTKSVESKTPVELNQLGGSWTLYTMEDNNGDYPSNADVTIAFSVGDEVEMYGVAGVNRYFGAVVINGNDFTSHAIGATKMAGPIAEMETEDNYLRILNEVNSIQIIYDYDVEQLVLTGENGQQLIYIR